MVKTCHNFLFGPFNFLTEKLLYLPSSEGRPKVHVANLFFNFFSLGYYQNLFGLLFKVSI
jgi:hypothetical protein